MNKGGGTPRFLRIYGAWIVLVTALVVAAAVGVSTRMPREFESSAIVVVEARVRPNTTPVAPDMGTEKELAQSGLVVGPAAKKLGVPPGDLLDGLKVGVAADANVLTFTYRTTDAVTAQRRAQALATAYVDYRNAGEAAESPANRAATTTATQHATLVTPAVVPTDPVAHQMVVYVGVGLAVGLLLGVGTALLRDRTSDRIRGRDDFARVSGATVLATVPRIRGRRSDRRPVLLSDPGSPAAESFRYLRSRLQPMLDGGAVVLVASAGDSEGRSTTAANLAVAVAQAGHDVVLIDADLRNPRLHSLFGAPDRTGLADVLSGRRSVEQALQETTVPHLRLLTAGNLADNASDLLDAARLRSVLTVARSRARVVVLDSAAVLSVSDPIVLAAAADHVLLVGDYRRTTRGFVTRMRAELAGVLRGEVSAVLLNTPSGAGGLIPRGRPQNGTIIEALRTGSVYNDGSAVAAPAPPPFPARTAGPDPSGPNLPPGFPVQDLSARDFSNLKRAKEVPETTPWFGI